MARLHKETPLETEERVLAGRILSLEAWEANHPGEPTPWPAMIEDSRATIALRKAGDDDTIVHTATQAWYAERDAQEAAKTLSDSEWTPAAVLQVAEGLGRKLEVGDVTDELYDYAVSWLRLKPTPISFEYLADLRKQMDEGKELTIPQSKGVLNCIVADARRSGAAALHATPPARAGAAPTTRAPERADVASLLPGIYGQADTSAGAGGRAIFKVQAALHGSQHLYAKRLIVGPDGTKGRFEYEKGAIGKLRPEDRLTLEQAKEFGVIYGVCCVCGALLTDEDSIAAGIGPICAGRLG